MTNRNERYSIRKYDSIANKYDKSRDGKYTAKFRRIILDMCDVKNGDKVLDVGCGNGSLLNEINRKTRIKGFGVDISPNMVEICRQRYTNFNFKIASGEEMQFDNSSFDMIITCCALHHMYNPINFINEAHRILKKGGVLIVGEPLFPPGIRHFFDAAIAPLLQAGDNKLFSHKQLIMLFTENGFTISRIYKQGFKQIIAAAKD